jgi:hypothetical protein
MKRQRRESRILRNWTWTRRHACPASIEGRKKKERRGETTKERTEKRRKKEAERKRRQKKAEREGRKKDRESRKEEDIWKRKKETEERLPRKNEKVRRYWERGELERMPTLKSLNLYDLIDQSRAEENMFDVEFIVLNPDWRAQGSMKGREFKWK